jgi:hypothetical protein
MCTFSIFDAKRCKPRAQVGWVFVDHDRIFKKDFNLHEPTFVNLLIILINRQTYTLGFRGCDLLHSRDDRWLLDLNSGTLRDPWQRPRSSMRLISGAAGRAKVL